MRKTFFMVGAALSLTLLLAGCDWFTEDTEDPRRITGTVSITRPQAAQRGPQIGDTLTVNDNLVGGSGALSVEWFANSAFGSPPSSTGNSLTLTSAHEGYSISVRVSRQGYLGELSSASVGPVTVATAAGPELEGTPLVTGTLSVGSTLTATVGGVTGTGAPFFQWRRGGIPIPGAYSNTYVLAPDDIGQTIIVAVTRRGSHGVVLSAPTQMITP